MIRETRREKWGTKTKQKRGKSTISNTFVKIGGKKNLNELQAKWRALSRVENDKKEYGSKYGGLKTPNENVNEF